MVVNVQNVDIQEAMHYVTNKIANQTPNFYRKLTKWPELDTKFLIDKQLDQPGEIDMFLGREVYAKLIDM